MYHLILFLEDLEALKKFLSISSRTLFLGFSFLTNSWGCWEKLNNGCCGKKGVWNGGADGGGLRNVDGGGDCNGGCGGWGGGGRKNNEGGGGGERLLLLSFSFSNLFLSL